MSKPVTVIVPVKLAPGVTEATLLAASEKFQQAFVSTQPGVLRRELIRTGDGQYMDIILFASEQVAREVIAAEAESPACHAFLSIMDLRDMPEDIAFHPSLAVYS